MDLSIVVRTLNEEKYLGELLQAVENQALQHLEHEIILVDSGSTDSTLTIARDFGVKVVHISREEFSFGRSLNMGCEAASGRTLVFVSGHCVPCDVTWLRELTRPVLEGTVCYAYGKQVGRDAAKFSERRVFEKYFPSEDMIPQSGFFCNNANAALSRESWSKYQFNEQLTGLEDMYLAKQMVADGERIGYVSSAPVFHIHDESWANIRTRYEREALALRQIMPEIHMSLLDLLSLVSSSIAGDLSAAWSEGVLSREATKIFAYRFCQYYGSYRGNHIHRQLSREMKRRYFYPDESVTQRLIADDVD